MFGIYFGKYLVDEKIITPVQYDKLIERTKNSKVQMGLLAVEMGLMDEDQTEEVNQIQQTEDKRFGDIAIERGYLTEDDVTDILERQGDPYLLFIQALVEEDILTIEEIREELIVYRKTKELTLSDLEALKTGDVDRITPVFIKNMDMPDAFRNYVMLTSRNIVRFVDRFFRMERIEKIDEITVPNLALQRISEGYPCYTAFAGTDASISALAHGFARTAFKVDDEITCTLDATKEFLNCNNGLFLTDLSKSQNRINVEYPITRDTQVTISANDMYRIPYYVSGMELDLILCKNAGFRMEDA
ncbi:MAG: hypothetical protein IJ733_18425 [Lachnospiraceae bacterium]|nr:hypothetical protein [Lachnospiraceae bacterium]